MNFIDFNNKFRDIKSCIDYIKSLFSNEIRCPFCHNGESVLNSNTPIPFHEIYEFLKSRVGLIDAVVFTGGEPTIMPELVERIENATRYVIQTVRKDLFQTRFLQFQHIIAVFLYGILAQERSVSLVRLSAHLYLPIVGGSAELQNRIHLPPLSPRRIQPELRASEPGHRRSIGNTIDNPDSGEIRLLKVVRAGVR